MTREEHQVKLREQVRAEEMADEIAWNMYRDTAAADLWAFTHVLEQDLALDDEQLEIIGERLETLRGRTTTAEAESSIQHYETQDSRYWISGWSRVVRLTAIWNLLRYRVEHPNEETVPTWMDLREEDRRAMRPKEIRLDNFSETTQRIILEKIEKDNCDRAIADAFIKARESMRYEAAMDEVARQFGVSEPTVYRAQKKFLQNDEGKTSTG